MVDGWRRILDEAGTINEAKAETPAVRSRANWDKEWDAPTSGVTWAHGFTHISTREHLRRPPMSEVEEVELRPEGFMDTFKRRVRGLFGRG